MKDSLREKISKKSKDIIVKSMVLDENKIITDLGNKLSIVKVIEEHLDHKITKMVPLVYKKRVVKNPDKVLCVVLSDLHIGKKIKGYDFEIFKEKLESIFNQIIEMLETKGINKMHLFILGDIVDGDGNVHPGQASHLCLNASEQAINGAETLSNFVNSLLSHCVKIEITTATGNHGRAKRKGEGTPSENWDYILYHMMKLHLKNASNVSFNISDEWKQIVKVGDLKVLAFHGDDITSGKPLNSLPTAMVRWADMLRNEDNFDVAVCGHFHVACLGIDVNSRELFVNGSTVPCDEYVEKKIKEKSKCAQICWVVNGNKIEDRNLLVV